MKQIDIIKTYAQKRCLIVEDNPDVRTALRRCLVDFGAVDVDTAGHAGEAIEACQRHHYDIVLSDYNLGKGRTGQQLLEELRHAGLLKNTSVFIMVTAEAGVQQVVHALECEPDDYLGKPINRESLRPRLDAVVMRKEALSEIHRAIDAKRPRSAIDHCQTLLAESHRYSSDIKRLLGELHCDQRQFSEALTLYSEFDEIRAPLWAKVGKATALLGLKDYNAAEQLLLNLIEENPYCVDALDLLAKVYEGKNKPDLAQHALARAVTINPMSAQRQREMGRLSLEIGELHVAAHAYRAAIKHSKHSCLENPEDFTNLTATLGQLIRSQGKADQALMQEAQENLKHLDKKYAKHPVVQLRRQLAEADVWRAAGNESLAEQSDSGALETLTNLRLSVLEHTPTQLCIDCARALMNRGRYDEGERLLQEVAKLNRDPAFSLKIDKLLREPVTKEGIAHAAKLNKQGIEFHKAERYDQAIRAFVKVLNELPNHIGLNLNLVQSIISKCKQQPASEKELALIQSSFQRIGKLADDSSYKQRFEYLQKRMEKLGGNAPPGA